MIIHLAVIDSRRVPPQLRRNLESLLSIAGFTQQDGNKPNISVWSIPGDAEIPICTTWPITQVKQTIPRSRIIDHTTYLLGLVDRWELDQKVPYTRLIKLGESLADRCNEFVIDDSKDLS